MNLSEYRVNDFIHELASDSPAPGGGSASALAGSIGSALCSMVASLTAGKEKYREHEALMQELIEQTAVLTDGFLDSIDKDTEAFNGVSAVFAMPKGTDEEKAARRAAMQDALKAATRVPYSMMELSLAALELVEKAVGRSNTNAASDLGVAALNLKAAVQGAWLNVRINLAGIKDEAFVMKYRSRGEGIPVTAP